jgi:hypothetical protein
MYSKESLKAGLGYSGVIRPEFKADFEQQYTTLIVVPEEVDSYLCVNYLNYFGFPFKLEEDNIFKQEIKKEMGFDKSDKYPILIIESNKNDMKSADLS